METMVAKSPDKNFWHNKKVLVTGHTGFKGSWLVHILNKLGCKIVGCGLQSRISPCIYTTANIAKLVVNKELGLPEFSDIRHYDNLKAFFSSFQPDIVFHMAAQPLVIDSYLDPVDTYATNVMGTVNVMDLIRSTESTQCVVVVTTDKVYQNEEHVWPYREYNKLGGVDPYSASKACAEVVVSSYKKAFLKEQQVGVATARAGNVIGGGDWSPNRLLPDIIKSVMSKMPLNLRNPSATRPWQHVLEPLWGYILLAENLCADKNLFSQSYNFGPDLDDNLSVETVAEIALAKMHSCRNISLNKNVNFHESQLLMLDSTKAKLELGWRPRWSSQQAIGATCDWYLKANKGTDISELYQSQIESYFRSGKGQN